MPLAIAEQAFQIAAQDAGGCFFAHIEGLQRCYLLGENVGVPASWKKRTVGAEQETIGAEDVQGPPEDHREVQLRSVVLHPTVAARGVQVNVRAQVAEHERFAEVACAEVWDYEIQFRVEQRDGV